nr:helix-turn-helix transcriptional regulator [Brevibacillus laterosporus]
MCDQARLTEDVRRYQVIYDLYLSDKKMTAEEIAECHKIDQSTVYRDVKEAVKTLSVLMFGVDGVHFNM